MVEDARIADLCYRLRTRLKFERYLNASPFGSQSMLGAPQLATEEQVRETEYKLGFPLPPFLRAFYTSVTNSTFGLGRETLYYSSEGGCRTRTPIEQTLSRSGWRLHSRVVEALSQRPGTYVFSDECPDRFLTLGAGATGLQSIELDGWTGAVYLVEYDGDALPQANGEDIHLVRIQFGASDLQDWFERWLEQSDFYLVHPDVQLRPEEVELAGLTNEMEVWRGLYRVQELREGDESPDVTS